MHNILCDIKPITPIVLTEWSLLSSLFYLFETVRSKLITLEETGIKYGNCLVHIKNITKI